MHADCFLPPGLHPDGFAVAERRGVAYSSASWTPAGLERLAAHLGERGPAAIDAVSVPDRLAAWEGAVTALRDARYPTRREIVPALARLCRLSPPGVEAALDTLLEGASGPSARRMAESARATSDRRPVVVLLAGNLPALALQALLPPLLAGRPVLLKSPTAEPLFAPRLAAEVCRREPALADAIAAVTWAGGETSLETPVLAAASRVVAYGDRPALDDLAERVGDRLVALGPGLSLAAIGADIDPEGVAPEIARDVALFDQRGCLSVHAVYTAGDPLRLADALARALRELAHRWPPGPPEASAVGAVQQLRLEAELRGLHRPSLDLAEGTVVVEPRPELLASPGLRSVRVQPLPSLDELPTLLEPWRGRVQGVALGGRKARALGQALRRLEVFRRCPPGQLQRADFDWSNGGRSPLETFGG